MAVSDWSALRQALASQDAPSLKARGVLLETLLPTRKPELVEILLSHLTDPAFLRERYERLSDLERNAVREAVYAGGPLDFTAFQAKYGRLPDFGTSRTGYASATAVPLSLFFIGHSIPRDLVRALKEFVPKPEEFVLAGQDEAPEAFTPEDGEPVPLERVDTERAAFHDMLAVLDLVRNGKLSVGEKTGVPGAAALKTLTPRLLLPDYFANVGTEADDTIRAYGLIASALMGGLARAVGPKLQLTRAGEAFLRDPTAARLREAWERYLRADKPDELRRISSLKGQTSTRAHLTRPSERKAEIADALGRCPVGQWIDIESFFRALRIWRLDPGIETGMHSGGLYVGYSLEHGWLGYSHIDYFRVAQAPYVMAVLWEYAASFGAVDILYTGPEESCYPTPEYSDDVYYSRYDGLKHFRINALGAYLLGRTQSYEGPPAMERAAAFTVLPNLEIAVTAPQLLAPNDRAFLERVAEPAAEATFRLEREKLLTAVEEGLPVKDVAEFLERRGARAMPETVSRFLADAAANAAALETPQPALLVRCRDPHVRDLIVHDSVLGKLCLPTGKEHLAIPEAEEAAVRRRLKKIGYVLPR